jgi:starch-binding outer membrane protein, SusD/RagB family
MSTKNNMTHFKYLATFFVFLSSFFSCERFLALEPETSLSSAKAFDSIEGVEAGINGAYSTLHQEWVERQYVFAECLAGNVFEVNSLSNSNYQGALRHQAWTDLFNIGNYLWSLSYRAIDLCNQVIVSIPDIPEPNQLISSGKRKLLGEAYFLRGLNYFVLNRFFGNPKNGLSVPVLTSPFQPDDKPARATIAATQNQVIADLEEAEKLLEGIESNNGRATVWAAKALLARVHFEYKNYPAAAAYASEVIQNGQINGRKLTLLSGDLRAPFSPDISSENVFTFMGNPRDRANVQLFKMFSLSSSAVELSVSSPFWQVISKEPKDLRLKQLHQDFNVARACLKYDNRDMNIPYIRLPEMYLIRAESNAVLGSLDLALADLNVLRTRAGLSATTFQNKEELLEKILRERSLELSMEGDNLHNLKRLQQPIGGLLWEEAAYKLVFFIPEKEIQVNPNLIQNEIW